MKSTLFTLMALALFSFSPTNRNIDESINTLEDIQEWIASDVDDGYTDGERGASYILNIDQVIKRLNKEKNK